MKTTLLYVLFLTLSFTSFSQNVNIPDANFKAALVANANINTNGDTEIQLTEASAYTGGIGVGDRDIADLTGLEEFTEIVVFGAFKNPRLTSIDISQNTKLTQLLIEQTGITGTLDLSMLTNLRDFKGHTTGITAINMANGNNANVTRFNVVNSAVRCVQIDPGFTPNNDWDIPPSGSFSETCEQFTPPCFVAIPDANFKAALVADAAINTNGNSEIECDEASAFTGEISVQSASIIDMTGIEAFTSVTSLKCNNNQITFIKSCCFSI